MRVKKAGVDPSNFTLPTDPVQLLIHYAKEDTRTFEALQRQFAPDTRIKVLDPYNIIPGTKWAQARDNTIRQAECIVFLFSADFFGSAVLYQEAKWLVVNRRQELVQDGLMLAMIIRPVDWNYGFARSLSVIQNGKVIQGEGGLVKAVGEIKRILENKNLL